MEEMAVLYWMHKCKRVILQLDNNGHVFGSFFRITQSQLKAGETNTAALYIGVEQAFAQNPSHDIRVVVCNQMRTQFEGFTKRDGVVKSGNNLYYIHIKD